jgi:hypothetical protein
MFVLLASLACRSLRRWAPQRPTSTRSSATGYRAEICVSGVDSADKCSQRVGLSAYVARTCAHVFVPAGDAARGHRRGTSFVCACRAARPGASARPARRHDAHRAHTQWYAARTCARRLPPPRCRRPPPRDDDLRALHRAFSISVGASVDGIAGSGGVAGRSSAACRGAASSAGSGSSAATLARTGRRVCTMRAEPGARDRRCRR